MTPLILLKKLIETPSRSKTPYDAPSALRREYSILRHYIYYNRGRRRGFFSSEHKYSGPIGFFRMKSEVGRMAAPSRKFAALADAEKIVFVAPKSISSKLVYDLDIYFSDILCGDWDKERAVPLDDTTKQRSIRQHFIQRLPWEETDIFKSAYKARLRHGNQVRGLNKIEDLVAQYHQKVDGLFESMRQNGFLVSKDPEHRPISLPHVHIGRNGEFLFGNNGNHRLAFAKLLNLEAIPCWVRGRHLSWQEVREEVARCVQSGVPQPAGYEGHPDLADLVGSPPGSAAVASPRNAL